MIQLKPMDISTQKVFIPRRFQMRRTQKVLTHSLWVRLHMLEARALKRVKMLKPL